MEHVRYKARLPFTAAFFSSLRCLPSFAPKEHRRLGWLRPGVVGVLPVKQMLANLTQGVPFLDARWLLMSKQADMSSSDGAFDAAVCLAMAHHPRLGAASPLRVLPPDVLQLIAKNVRHERRPFAMLLTVLPSGVPQMHFVRVEEEEMARLEWRSYYMRTAQLAMAHELSVTLEEHVEVDFLDWCAWVYDVRGRVRDTAIFSAAACVGFACGLFCCEVRAVG